MQKISSPWSTSPTESSGGTNRSLFVRISVGVAIIFAMIVGYWLGRTQLTLSDQKISLTNACIVNAELSNRIDFQLFWDAWSVVREHYVGRDAVDARAMVYGAIHGMVAALGDPYTMFLTPEELTAFTEDLTGSFDGIGAELGMRDGILTVIAPLEGSPAARADLRSGDAILKINDEDTTHMSIDGAVGKIRGQRGTVVTLTIYRSGEDEPRTMAITREEIIVHSVTHTVADGIGTITISRFGPDTTANFEKAARAVMQTHPKGIIIDLRNNPGGYLDSAVDIASMLLPIGSSVVISEDAKKTQTISRTTRQPFMDRVPIALLINEGSASASEILAGALRDHRNDVRIIGTKSFGKGSVQELLDLPQKTAIKVTIAEWLTPKGDHINNVGIVPHDVVERSEEDRAAQRDPQRDAALTWLRAQGN